MNCPLMWPKDAGIVFPLLAQHFIEYVFTVRASDEGELRSHHSRSKTLVPCRPKLFVPSSSVQREQRARVQAERAIRVCVVMITFAL